MTGKRRNYWPWRSSTPESVTTNGTRKPTARIDYVVATGVAGVALLCAARAFASPAPLPRWQNCDDAVTIVDRRLPTPPDEAPGGNRAAHILGRIWASRPELHADLSTDGRPNTEALAAWAASIPDIASLPIAACVDDLAVLVDPSVSLANMRSLDSLLEWTRVRSHGSFYELEANRNIAFDLFVEARSSLLADQDSLRFVTGDEIIAWAWALAPDDPAFDRAWNALDRLSISED